MRIGFLVRLGRVRIGGGLWVCETHFGFFPFGKRHHVYHELPGHHLGRLGLPGLPGLPGLKVQFRACLFDLTYRHGQAIELVGYPALYKDILPDI